MARLANLPEPARVELRLPESLKGQLEAKPLVLDAKTKEAVLRITSVATLRGRHTITIRATAVQDGKYPVVTETAISVEFLPATPPAKGR